jgi:hypothetical protein
MIAPDVLLTVGVAVVAWVCGVQLGAQLMADIPTLPDHVTAAAQQLGELHLAHERAKGARDDVNVRLAAYIDKLKQLFSWKE